MSVSTGTAPPAKPYSPGRDAEMGHHLPSYSEFLAPGEPGESLAWRTKIIQRSKWLSGHIWRHWYRLYESQGYVKANLFLVDLQDRFRLGGTGLSIDTTDEAIKDYAKVKTRSIASDTVDFGTRFDRHTAIWSIKGLFERIGLPFPLEDRYWQKDYDSGKVVAALARIQDPRWLARQLRVKASREVEQVCRELGLVRKGAAPYLSDFSLRRMLSRKKSSRELLEKLVATNDLGQQYTLAELADLGVSNPVLRRGELMTRLNGFEEWTKQDTRQWTAMFYTETAPSKYHPLTSHGGKVRRNPKYNGATPRDAQAYLNGVWQRFRAEADRREFEYFGFRVVEPHHDGTPHWHLLIFVRKEQQEQFTSILREYAMEEYSDEPGADKHRFEAVRIDPEKGRATGYIAKYIAKNVDGYKVEFDEEAQDYASLAAVRAGCWASLWGIRQFQQLGGPPVTVWRELRRVGVDALHAPLEGNEESKEKLLKLHEAADAGNWKDYTELMGGARVRRDDLALRAKYFSKPEANDYGEDIKKLYGLISPSGRSIKTRLRTWTISLGKPHSFAEGEGLKTGPPTAAPLEFCQ